MDLKANKGSLIDYTADFIFTISLMASGLEIPISPNIQSSPAIDIILGLKPEEDVSYNRY